MPPETANDTGNQTGNQTSSARPQGPARTQRRGAPTAFVIPMRRVLRIGGTGFAVALPVATVLAWLIGGPAVGWGVGLGLLLPAVFFAVTVVVGLLVASLANTVFAGVVVASWLVKIVVLLVVMALLGDAEFYSRPAFLAAFVVGVVAWLAAEGIVVLKARVPYVEPDGHAGGGGRPAGSEDA